MKTAQSTIIAILLLATFAAPLYAQQTYAIHPGSDAYNDIMRLPQHQAAAEGDRAIAATYRVKVSRGGMANYGSGTAISPNWLVTCHHVVGVAKTQVTITGNGVNLTGVVKASDRNMDVAIVYCAAGFPSHVPVAATDPQRGEIVQLAGYGPDGVLKSGVGRVTSTHGTHAGYRDVNTSARIVSGDSGGGMFNAAGELCGLNCRVTPDSQRGGDIAGPSASRPSSVIRELVRDYEVQCYGGQCAPQQQQYSQQPLQGSLVPVRPRPQLPQQPEPPSILVPTPAPPEIDYARIEAMIAAAIAKIPAGAQGPPGEPGQPGEPGERGPQGRNSEPIVLRVHFLDRDGKVAFEQVVAFDKGHGTLLIPPVKVNIYDDLNGDKAMADSEIFRLVEPLGQPIKLEVTGGIKASGK